MRFGAVGYVIAHAGLQLEMSAVRELGVELALEAQHEVALRAPVVGAIAGRVVEHAQAHVAEMPRSPVRFAGFAGMNRAFDGIPIESAERQTFYLHVQYLPASTSANTAEST